MSMWKQAIGVTFVVAVSLVLFGCSSSAPQQPATAPSTQPEPQPAAEPADTDVAEPVPVATAMPPDDSKAWVTVYRKKRFLGAALNTSVFVDGVEVADLDPGTYVRVALDPGTHTFHSDEEKNAVDLDLEGGKHYFFRMELQAGMWKGHGVLRKVDLAEGATEFKEWKLKIAKDIRTPDMVIKDPSKE